MWTRILTYLKNAKDAATPHARYFGALAGLLAFCVIAYWYRWAHMPPANNGAVTDLPSVMTPSGVPAYLPPEIPSAKPPKVVKRPVTRPVYGTPVVHLPPVELNYVPSTLPPSGLGKDNVIRETELIATAVVPPHRGDTDVRTYLDPAGDARTYLYPKREAFLGFNPLAIELSAGVGIGGSKADIRADYRPLRLGDFHVGAEVRGWQEPDGTMKGAGSVRVYYEPFR